jgi:REP element-mobilizing transposase RayT
MILSHVGVIADLCWQQTMQTSPDWECIEYVIMPDHFHALVRKVDRTQDAETPTDQTAVNQETGRHTRYRNPGKNTLSSLVGKYKSMVTRHARRLGYEHVWQGRFHDSIVREKQGILKVQRYIQNNVRNWSRAH